MMDETAICHPAQRFSASNPCTTCGACCALFRVDFHESEARAIAQWVVPVIGKTVRMRGTDAPQPRCAALVGEVGVAVFCRIYPDRPAPCREFAPLAPLGVGSPECDRARRRYGLPPLS